MIISYRCLLLAFTGLALVESKLNYTNDGAKECVRKNNGPLITPCVSEITLKKGQNFTLTCKGVTKLRFRQQDVSEEVTSNFTIVNTSTPIHENEYSFQRTLDLYNVDQFAIGYYACSDESVDEDIVNKITEEPENNEHVSYIYVYVNGTGSLFAPMTELILSRCNKILIECRPSTPDVEVSLTSTKSQNKTPKYSPKIGFILKKCDSFAYICRGQRGEIIDKKRIQRVQEPPTPVLEEVPVRFLKGDNFTLICTANITINQIVKLSWKYPEDLPQNEIIMKEDTNAGYVTQGVIYKKITIFNATKKHAGYYLCLSSSNCGNKESNKVYKEFVEKPFLNLALKNRGGITLQHKTSLSLDLDAHPEVTSFHIVILFCDQWSGVQVTCNAGFLNFELLCEKGGMTTFNPKDANQMYAHLTRAENGEGKYREEASSTIVLLFFYWNAIELYKYQSFHMCVKNMGVISDVNFCTKYLNLKDGVDLPYNKTDKFILIFQNSSASVLLRIDPVTVTDMANYTFIASNGNITKNETYQLRVKGKPKVNFGESNVTCLKGTKHSFRCDVSGYPLPKVSWLLSYNNETLNVSSTSEEALLYNKTAFLDLQQCDREGSITCTAGSDTKTRELFVYEITDGFGILTESENKQTWVLENDIVSLKCLASKHIFSNVTWEIDNKIYSRAMVEHPTPTDLSLVAELQINYIPVDHSGIYKCVGTKHDGSYKDDSIEINVLKLQPPVIVGKPVTDEEVFRFDSMRLNCTVMGAPLPHIEWFQDGKLKAANFSNVKIYQNNLDLTTINSTIYIEKMQPENFGKWECVAKGRDYIQRKSFTLKLKVEKESNKSVMHYLIAIAVIIIILIILIVYLTVKIKKEKRFRKELAAAGLLYFKEGVINSLNPDLGIDEQAELLPYDEKFEFPRDKLNLGIQLGAGAFGIVYKAEARGIINAEETTTVAVKMVKKTADNMYIKALASELKIMVHLGKHINIVNLLGACTKNVVKRELVVIVEYCKYGNIHNYMQRHREVFIDQLDTGNKDKLGTVNRAYTTTSTGSTGVNSEYFGSNNTQDTDHTFVNTANTVRSARKNCPNNQQTEEVKASEGYVQPEWRSNYESDYSYDGRSPRPLSSRDLLAWSFQISRGMEYLASRKVLHGDLAARNILLADDNIVKICDFGLAKSIYKNDEYQKKENCPLPVKWLAIECMTDRIFSTQSDVWSFGIVLWELFTLAKTPYPNIHPTSLLPFLSEGHRLNKPAYADDRLYDVMKRCWEAKPLLRPTFSQLQELLGTFLEDNVRNHYVDLNSTYMDKNAKAGTQEDYLAMMCAPDYNNLVTPSPHHYVNTDTQKSFFPPTPVKVDDEGYLQMSPTNQGIFSPRNPNSEFDFDLDPRKFNAKTSDAGSCGSELTPMLTLNNLPARSGSESDHEGNAPYLNVCKPIEEVDEVFAPTLNETKNAKNMQQSAVTNPTYITFDNINEKPKDIINYVNINVPNGLVK